MPLGVYPRSVRQLLFVIGPSIAYVPLTQGGDWKLARLPKRVANSEREILLSVAREQRSDLLRHTLDTRSSLRGFLCRSDQASR